MSEILPSRRNMMGNQEQQGETNEILPEIGEKHETTTEKDETCEIS